MRSELIKWRRDRSRLSSLIREEREKLCKPDRKKSIKNLLLQIYVPSLASFLTVLFLLGLFFILSHFLGQILESLRLGNFIFLELQRISQEANHYQNLIAIHAGISAIIFALVIFIAESMRDDETKDRARVLLRESYLFPLTVTEILIFFIFIWGDVNVLSILPIIGIGFFTIFSLGRIITVLLSRYRFAQKRAELLKERLQQSIDLAINERIGNNILFSKLDGKEIKLEYYPFVEKKMDYYCFNADKFGIVDVKLEKLRELADLVDEKARENGFSFEEEEKSEPVIGEEVETQSQKTKTLIRNRKRYLLKKFHDLVDEEHNTLICIDKNLIKDEALLLKLDTLVKQAFVIKKDDNFAEEVRYEISGLKDQFITAINNKQLGKIEELIKLYIRLAEGFLELITKCGGGYSFEQAQKERHALFAGWKEVRWLSSDIKELFEKAMETHDKEIIRNIAYLPIAIARRAIDYKDHYLFQEFIWFAEFLYIYAKKEQDKDLKELMIDRSWRYLKEISSTYVEAKLRRYDLSDEELKTLKDFAVYFFVIFQNLLKRAFKNKDFESFEIFKSATLGLFGYFKPSESLQNAKDLKWRLEKLKPTSSQKKELENLLQRQEFMEEIEEEIKNRRSQMLFGLTSWILDEFSRNKTDELTRRFYNSIQNIFPSKLEDFTQIFLSAHSFDVEDFWGWGFWEIKTEGKMQSIQVLEKLERFYAVKALSILAAKTDEEIRKIELPYNRDLAYLAEGTRDLMKILDNISASPENWRFVLSENAIRKVSSLKELLKKAKEAQEKEEIEFKRKSPISQKKVNEFKTSVVSGFYESVVIRDIFGYYGLYQDETKESFEGEKSRFGINIVEDKAIFFEDWYVHYVDRGKYYGRDLASGENSCLLDEIANHCQEITEEEFEDKLAKSENTKDIILFATNGALWRFFKNSKNFKPKWYKDIPQLDVKGFEGWYKFKGQFIPIFEAYPRKIGKKIFILNKARLGSLVQYSPLNKGEDEKLLKDIFYMNIQAFSENSELMKNFIEKPPGWLRELGDEQKQREHLQERVRIQIFERFEYKKSEEFEGYLLKLKE